MVNGLNPGVSAVHLGENSLQKVAVVGGGGGGGGGGRQGGGGWGGGGREGAVRFSYLLWILMWPINIVTSGHNYWKLM